jgi:sugar phosphate isomerase/epimerase
MFSKHLAELAWGDLGTAVRQAGFDGVDLTVRPGGHVVPARVSEDLPRAVAAIRDAGSLVAMLTTGLTQPGDAAARATFEAARSVGVPRLKAGYYRYAFADARRELAEATTAFHGLVRMAAAAGVVLAYHNHSGDYVGAPMWDALRMIEGQPADATGFYFDVRHATVEGGLGGWRAAVQMAAPHLRMLALKDFYWEKGANGRWRVVDCPIGDGMVDWKAFGDELRKARFSGPMSLHVEYDPGGRTAVEKTERMIAAAVRDRTRVLALLGGVAAGA